jgi:hypothetical protein
LIATSIQSMKGVPSFGVLTFKGIMVCSLTALRDYLVSATG